MFPQRKIEIRNILPLFSLALLLGGAGCKDEVGSSLPPGPPWIVLTTTNSPLVNNSINAIAEDAEGKIWFGTGGGASAFTKKSWVSIRDSLTFLTYKPPNLVYVENIVASIAIGKDHSVWFGLPGGGAARYNQNGTMPWFRYREDQGLISNMIQKVAANRYDPGDIWFATSVGISRFYPSQTDPTLGEWTSFNVKNVPELTTDHISTVTMNNIDNSVWFGTQTGVVVNTSREVFFRWTDHSPPNNRYAITAISFDKYNNPWIGTTYGAWKHDLNLSTWINHTHESTGGKLPRSGINDLVVDGNMTVWFGTNAGLIQMKDTTWKSFSHLNSPLPNDTVRSLYLDSNGNLWIGTIKGVAAYREQGTKF